MAIAPFFERIFNAVGRHAAISREHLEKQLNKQVVAVACADSCKTGNDRSTVELAVNLFARLYPRLALSGPSGTVDELRSLASRINPSIEFEDPRHATAIVAVDVDAPSGAIHASAQGWVAKNASTRMSAGLENPYAAGAAACLAVAQVFRRSFLDSPPEKDFSLSLLNYQADGGHDTSLPSDVGSVAFVGLGAVGNGALWAMARHPNLRAELDLVDAEKLSLLNLQRYVLGDVAAVGVHKTRIASQALGHRSLQIREHPLSLDEFIDSNHGVLEAPTVCVSVDNVDARRTAQAMLPRLVVNGWTGEGALGASWHVLSRDVACLACLYQPRGPSPSQTELAAAALGLSHERVGILWMRREPVSGDDVITVAKHLGVATKTLEPWIGKLIADLYTDVVCGAVPINLPGLKRIEVVPLAHQSALAGVLMAAELVKRTSPHMAELSQGESLVTWGDVLRPPPPLWAVPRPREPGCICGDETYQRAYATKWSLLP